MTHDLTRIRQLGKQRKRLLDQLEQIREQLVPEVNQAAASGVEQKTLAELTHYTRETIRQMCLTPEQKEAEAEKRRARTRKAG